jgi:hypothetical protein
MRNKLSKWPYAEPKCTAISVPVFVYVYVHLRYHGYYCIFLVHLVSIPIEFLVFELGNGDMSLKIVHILWRGEKHIMETFKMPGPR